jgi:hypothetical protein
MARRLTAAQAKAAKQKKLVIVLVVVFVGVAVIQVPRLMKQLHPKAAGMAPPTPGSVAASATSAANLAPTPGAPSQLHTFSRLKWKDPFKPLVTVPQAAADGSSTPAPSDTSTKPPATPTQAAAGEAPASGTVKFSESKPPPNAAIVTTNGKRQLVYVGDGFPTASPLFRLVALGKQTVRVGVLSGGFSSGVPTIRLIRGKRVTLANEADGSHYVIELIRLATAAPKSAAAATTTTPAATTTTPAAATTTTPTTTTPTTTTTP